VVTRKVPAKRAAAGLTVKGVTRKVPAKRAAAGLTVKGVTRKVPARRAAAIILILGIRARQAAAGDNGLLTGEVRAVQQAVTGQVEAARMWNL
jgi:hypothetical protein